MESRSESPVKSYYKNKSVLITSHTDFIVKFLILRLLQICDVSAIYILFKPSKSKSLREKFADFLGLEIFSFLQDKTVLDKIYPIEGDVSKASLGLKKGDRVVLANNVNLVFHSSDSSKLNKPLKSAVNLHVKGTKNVMDFSKSMANLDVFLFVSTLNALHTEGYLEEQVYPLRPYYYTLDPLKFMEKIQDMDDNYVAKIAPTFTGKHPNTFSFAKVMAENLVWDQREGLKVAIVRPSCLTAAYRYPDPGWFDTVQLPTAIMTLHTMGITRAINEDLFKHMPMVPADYLANMLISVGWFMAVKSDKNCLFYNMSSDSTNGVTVEQIHKFSLQNFERYPSTKAIRAPVEVKPQGKVAYYLNKEISEKWFAWFFDFLLLFTGRKPMLVFITNKLQNSLKYVVENFYTTSYSFGLINSKRLLEEMDIKDKATFEFDMNTVDWRQHFEDSYLRFRRFVLKEPDSNLSHAIKRMHQVSHVYQLFKYVGWSLMGAIVASGAYYALKGMY